MEKRMIEKFNEIMNDVKTNGEASKYLKKIGESNALFIDFNEVFIGFDYALIDTVHFYRKTFSYVKTDDGEYIIVFYKPLDKVIDIANSGNEDDIISLYDDENSDCFSIDDFSAMINALLDKNNI